MPTVVPATEMWRSGFEIFQRIFQHQFVDEARETIQIRFGYQFVYETTETIQVRT